MMFCDIVSRLKFQHSKMRNMAAILKVSIRDVRLGQTSPFPCAKHLKTIYNQLKCLITYCFWCVRRMKSSTFHRLPHTNKLRKGVVSGEIGVRQDKINGITKILLVLHTLYAYTLFHFYTYLNDIVCRSKCFRSMWKSSNFPK